MNPTTASVTCPACGQPFLCMQQNPEGVVQCPHCAHNGPRAQFGTQIQVLGIAPGRRQVTQTQPISATSIRPSPPPEQQPQPAAWPGSQPVVESPLPASIARATLQPSQALMPVGAPPPQPAEFITPPQLQAPPWRASFLALLALVVCAVAAWLWWNHSHPTAHFSANTTPAPVAPITRAPAIPPARPTVPIEVPDAASHAADAKLLVTELFAADTPERRAACVHDAEKHRAAIEAMLGPGASERPELRLLSRLPGFPLTLPGQKPVLLFKVVTSKCPAGALIRLETGADGKRRIHWPLFFETHEGSLQRFMENSVADDAAWFHTGLRLSHGLDIPAELRSKYLTFDVQACASSTPHFVACVERDSPLGRFMDREAEWGKACLARLLVRRLDIKADAPCMIVVDCEGAPER